MENSATSPLEFGEAVHYMCDGMKVYRQSWLAKGIYVFLVNYRSVEYYLRTEQYRTENHSSAAVVAPHFVMHTEDNQLIPYTFTPDDILSWDWVVLPGESSAQFYDQSNQAASGSFTPSSIKLPK